MLLLGMVVLAVGSFIEVGVDWGKLFSLDAAQRMGRFLGEMANPAREPAFLARLGVATLETLAMSAVGTLLAAMLGLLLALPASRVPGQPASLWLAPTRWLLNLLRSIPELVWAALLLISAGLGPLAGTLALALHTAGVLGRLFAEALENNPREPAAALSGSGAPAAAAFLYGDWPLLVPQVLAYSLYRWEMNIRMATILGFVGAGGLGQLLYYELSLFRQPQACTVILAMLLLTLLVDGVSALLRRPLRPARG